MERGVAGHLWELRDGQTDDRPGQDFDVVGMAGLQMSDVEIPSRERDYVRLRAAKVVSDRVLAELIAAGWHIEQVDDHGDHAHIVATRRPQ